MRHVLLPIGLGSLIALTAGGCTTLRYDVVAPPEARGEVEPNAGVPVVLDGIEYEVFQVEDKAVIRFVNRTGGPLRLTGQSTMRDSRGQSFTLDPQDVVPDQSGRIAVPPSFAAAQGQRTTPAAGDPLTGPYDNGGIIPERHTGVPTATAAPTPSFRWPAGQQARFRLVFDSAGKPISHEWVLRRSAEPRS